MADLDQVFRVPGCGVRYTDSGGSAGPVVLLHGAGADHSMFVDQHGALLAAGFRVVLLDLRGHGLSRPSTVPLTAGLLASDVEALLGQLGPAAPALVGHSLGGNLAQLLVRRNPGRYAALAVLDATWNTGPLTFAERLALAAAGPVLRVLPARALRRTMVEASAVTASARNELLGVFSAMSRAEFLSAWRATTEFVAPDPTYRTPVPLLLLRGGEDRTGNIATAMPRWAAAEGVDEIVVAGAGHVVTQDAPEVVTEALLSFLQHTVAAG
jgi:3-oxoadipate enol-lactonase